MLECVIRTTAAGRVDERSGENPGVVLWKDLVTSPFVGAMSDRSQSHTVMMGGTKENLSCPPCLSVAWDVDCINISATCA